MQSHSVLRNALWLHCLFLTLHKISTLLAAFEKEFPPSHPIQLDWLMKGELARDTEDCDRGDGRLISILTIILHSSDKSSCQYFSGPVFCFWLWRKLKIHPHLQLLIQFICPTFLPPFSLGFWVGPQIYASPLTTAAATELILPSSTSRQRERSRTRHGREKAVEQLPIVISTVKFRSGPSLGRLQACKLMD